MLSIVSVMRMVRPQAQHSCCRQHQQNYHLLSVFRAGPCFQLIKVRKRWLNEAWRDPATCLPKAGPALGTNQVAQGLDQWELETLQGCRQPSCSGWPTPLLCGESFSLYSGNFSRVSLCLLLLALPPCTALRSPGLCPSRHLAGAGGCWVPQSHPSSWLTHSQLPQSLLMGHVLHPHHPEGPFLSSLLFVHIFHLPGPKTGCSI